MNTTPLASTRQPIDIMLIVPLEEEYAQVEHIFPSVGDFSDDQHIVTAHQSPHPDVTIASVLQPRAGKPAASETVQYIESRFDVALYVIIGIAGSLSTDNALGDVVYSGTVFDILNNAATVETGTTAQALRLAPDVFHSNECILRALAFFKNHPRLKRNSESWTSDCGIWRELLAEELGADSPPPALFPNSVSVRTGPIVCGTVSKSAAFKNQLLQINRKLLAIETESGGAYEALSRSSKKDHVLVIRGISDFADRDKSNLEMDTKGLVRKCAAINAALFLSYQLRCPPFVNVIFSLRSVQSGRDFNSSPTRTSTQQLEDKVREVLDEVGERLNELSPEYRLKPDGYVLPVPRIRRDSLGLIEGGMTSPIAQDITDVLEKNRVTWIKLDTSYPDDSLPWVIAQHLLRQELGSNFILPVVLDGSQIRPPNGTIERCLSSRGISSFDQVHGCQIVIIVADPILSTENRKRYLSRQINDNPHYRFIFVTRDDFRIEDLAPSVGPADGERYRVDKVSFLELVSFLRTAFKMEVQKAEVLARRLDEIFSRFHLSAHPTYFAGIPEAMLNGFLQANRRSELIQLAVDGFLTFLVADDTADVALSRTTRQEFLRKLVYAVRVDLCRLGKADLVRMAEQFKELRDYDIDETRFVEDFFAKGILRMEDQRVGFALPFVESYLLALELRQRGESSQLAYFAFNPATFDVATFDLFCELSTEEGVVKALEARIQSDIEELGRIYPEKRVLLGNELQPVLIADPRSLQMLADGVREARLEVRRGDSKAVDKQRVLDVADEVAEAIGKRMGAAEEGGAAGKAEEGMEKGEGAEFVRRSALFDYFLGCLCLGAGAERLDAARKQSLIVKVLALGGHIADQWTSERSEIRASEIVADIAKTESHRQALAELGDRDKIHEFERMAKRFSEMVELLVLLMPATWVMGMMVQFGRHRVLAKSISAVRPSELGDGFQGVLRAIWLTEVQPDAGIRALRSSIRESNPGNFLRVLLVIWLLTGVHWDHWETDVRLKLIDLAYEILRPTSLSLDKEEVKRGLKRERR